MKWLTSLENAKEESFKTRKPILLMFVMDGCKGCKKMNETTFKEHKVIDEMNEWFELLKLDLIKDREVRKMLGAYWTPAFYFLDSNGSSYYHFNGYLPADEFRAMLRIGIGETLMPRGKYDDIIKIIDKDLNDLESTTFYPKLLVVREIARYIKTKDNSTLRNLLKELQTTHPLSTEAKMYFWDV